HQNIYWMETARNAGPRSARGGCLLLRWLPCKSWPRRRDGSPLALGALFASVEYTARGHARPVATRMTYERPWSPFTLRRRADCRRRPPPADRGPPPARTAGVSLHRGRGRPAGPRTDSPAKAAVRAARPGDARPGWPVGGTAAAHGPAQPRRSHQLSDWPR